MPPFRIYTQRHLPDAALVAAFEELATTDVTDCMGRKGALANIKRMGGTRILGVALTVRVRPGDNLMVHKALDMAGPGDVVVVADRADRSAAMVGEIMLAHAAWRGIAGLVTDGPIRDSDALPGIGLPVWAGGTTPIGPSRASAGDINIPVSISGVVIQPGDILLGDSDGIIAIPRESAAEVLVATRHYCLEDAEKVRAAHEGKLDRTWVDRELQELGCEVVDAVYPG